MTNDDLYETILVPLRQAVDDAFMTDEWPAAVKKYQDFQLFRLQNEVITEMGLRLQSKSYPMDIEVVAHLVMALMGHKEPLQLSPDYYERAAKQRAAEEADLRRISALNRAHL